MKITQEDLDSWCNCGNFPHNKCDECLNILGDVIYLGDKTLNVEL
jgi:hypothetical protein